MKKIGMTAVKTKKTTAKTKKASTNKKVAKKTYTITSKLPKGFKTSWVEALRSGEYNQTTGHLMDDFGFCSLGVGAKVCEIGDKHILHRGMLNKAKHTTKENREWNKIRTRIPAALRENSELQNWLAEMNDNGKSFKAIANYIEKNH